MKKTATAVAAAALISLGMAGCAQRQVPVATAYPTSDQQKMQASHHWDVLAENLAAGISGKVGNRPVYIAPSKQNTDFSQALRTLLTTRLVEKGITVSTSDAGNPLVLHYDSQVVSFRDREGLHPLPADFTLMKGVSYLIYRIGDLWAAPAWAILPLSEYQEQYFPDGTNSEAIVSVTINDGDKVVYSGSRIYYINDGEKGHYSGAALPAAPHTKNFKAVDQ